MANSEIRAVLTKELYDHVSEKAKAMGMTKAKWIAWLVAQNMASPSVVNVDRIVGAGAELMMLGSESAWILSASNERKQVVFNDGYLWIVTKTSNGSQKVLTKALACSEALFRVIAEKEHKLYSYSDIEDAPKKLEKLMAMPYAQEYADVTYHSDKPIITMSLASDSDFTYVVSGIKSYAKKQEEAKLALVEPTAAIEVAHTEIAIDEPNVPLSPYIEPVVDDTPLDGHLSSVEFQARFGFTVPSREYDQALKLGRGDGYMAKDGSVWTVAGAKKKAIWSLQLVKQLELAIA